MLAMVIGSVQLIFYCYSIDCSFPAQSWHSSGQRSIDHFEEEWLL